MINWWPEGAIPQTGLNIWATWKGKWFRIAWFWPDLRLRRVFKWYFRFRWNHKPHFIIETNRYDVVEMALFEINKVLITREQYENYIKPYMRES